MASNGSTLYNVDERADFWTNTPQTPANGNSHYFMVPQLIGYEVSQANYLAVRCVMDYPTD